MSENNNGLSKTTAPKPMVRYEELYRTIVENSFDFISVLDTQGRYVYANPIRYGAYRIEPEDLVGRSAFESVHPDDRQRVSEAFEETLRTRRPMEGVVYRLLVPDGSVIWLEARGALLPVGTDGVERGLVVARDITARKQAEDQVATLLREKELLLRETHHRIKNNMAVIETLFRLQADAPSATPKCEILRDAAGRVHNMMALYDQLYRSGGDTHLDLRDYLESIVPECVAQFPAGGRVRTDMDIESVELKAAILAPIGIMMNELVTNSMKHAFSDPRLETAGISVTVRRAGDAISLIYTDNGPGFPESIDFQESESFGLQLLRLLAVQIQGTISIDRDHGTVVRVTFPG